MSENTPSPTAPAAAPLPPAPPAPPPVQPPPHATGTRFREYETIFLVRPDLAEDLTDKLIERLRGIVTRDGGKVLRVSNWGKKKTAYEVKKHLRALFIHVLYLGDSKIVAEFERNLRMTDDVLKYQSVKIDENVDPNARPVENDVKLPGDPEMPERSAREPEGFGGGDSFVREPRVADIDAIPDEADDAVLP
jgi:small subunit ribosomal protein S6